MKKMTGVFVDLLSFENFDTEGRGIRGRFPERGRDDLRRGGACAMFLYRLWSPKVDVYLTGRSVKPIEMGNKGGG
jgi:hypothetical protein